MKRTNNHAKNQTNNQTPGQACEQRARRNKRLKFIIVSVVIALIFALTIRANAATVHASGLGQNQQTQSNVAPPTIQAEIIGSLLRIVAHDGFYPIEAVFVNGRRFNFRVNSALLIDISQYIVTGDTIAIYATDFAGNVSNTILLTPPPPIQPPQPNNLTPEGQGQVIDHATNSDLIEFITINTPAGNVFHLIIDHTRSGNNVYFLNAVTEWDLLTLAEEAELPAPPQFSPAPPPIMETPQEPPPQQEAPPTNEGDNGGTSMGMVIFFVIAGAGVFGAAYYFKILKPKQQRQMESMMDADEDAEEDGEDSEDGEYDEDEEAEDENGEDFYDYEDEGEDMPTDDSADGLVDDAYDTDGEESRSEADKPVI